MHQADEELGNFQIILQTTKNFLTKHDMNIKNYKTMFLWKSYLCQNQEISSYAEDWGQILHFVKSFVQIKSNASEFPASNDNYTYKDVFSAGNGKLVEIIVSWLVDDGCKVENLEKDHVKNLIRVASLHFPCR